MSKAILKFNLPEETQDFKDAMNGAEYKSVIFSIREKLIKQSESNLNEIYSNAEHAIDLVIDMINDELQDRNLLNDMG